MTLDAWLSAAHGDSSGLWFESSSPRSLSRRRLSGATSQLSQWLTTKLAKRYFSSSEPDRGSIIGNPGTEFLFGGGGLLHAWPANPDRQRVHPCPDIEGADAPDRRQSRLRHPARGCDQGAPPLPAQRPPGHARRLRPHDLLLDRAEPRRALT